MDNNGYEILGTAFIMALAAYSEKLIKDKTMEEYVEKEEYRDVEGDKKIKEVKEMLDRDIDQVAMFVYEFKDRLKQHGELFDAQLRTIEAFRSCR